MLNKENENIQNTPEEIKFIPCTLCGDCTERCPRQLDIPTLIAAYNEAVQNYSWYVEDVIYKLEKNKKPQSCINCGSCIPLCPRDIDIPDIMKKFSKIIKENS